MAGARGPGMNQYFPEAPPKAASALAVQAGGDHYRCNAIQPIEYIVANKLDFLRGNVIKYVTRDKAKNGAEDIKKALHYCQLILELEYGTKDAA
jgi:hypothetical protein